MPFADIDSNVPRPARVYNYLLGGKDNFGPDRAVANHLTVNVPHAAQLAQENRRFLHRAVRFMAARGITQFLDIGPGFPVPPTTDEIARQVDPAARVMYVDNDPMVINHTRALLKDARVDVLHLDMREPRLIFNSPKLRSLIDLSRPVGLVVTAVLHFLPEDEDLDELAASFRWRLPPGSHLALSHLTSTGTSPGCQKAVIDSWPDGAAVRPVFRTAEEISRVFGDWELVEPGLVDVADWRPTARRPEPRGTDIRCLGGVAVAG